MVCINKNWTIVMDTKSSEHVCCYFSLSLVISTILSFLSFLSCISFNSLMACISFFSFILLKRQKHDKFYKCQTFKDNKILQNYCFSLVYGIKIFVMSRFFIGSHKCNSCAKVFIAYLR